MDESFKRPGSVPFQWEIKPGIPKPYYQSQSKITTLFAPKKLNPPPIMTPPVSPSPSHSPAFFHRSNSTSPTKWHARRQGPSLIRALGSGPEIVEQGCVPLTMVRKTDGNRRNSRRKSANMTCNVRSSPVYSLSYYSLSSTRPVEVGEEVKSVAHWLS